MSPIIILLLVYVAWGCLIWGVGTGSAQPTWLIFPRILLRKQHLSLKTRLHLSFSALCLHAGIHGGCQVSRAVYLLCLGVCPGLSGSAPLPGARGDPDRWKRSAPSTLCANCCASQNVILTNPSWTPGFIWWNPRRWNLPLVVINSDLYFSGTLSLGTVFGSGPINSVQQLYRTCICSNQ